MAILSLLLGCTRSAPPPVPVSPKPLEERTWKQITVEGPYGTFEVAVPVISISTAQNAQGSILVDSVALLELEKRLTSRIAHIARAQAAALMVDTTATRFITRNPAPAIKPGLLASIPFELKDMVPSEEGRLRIGAAAAMLQELPGVIHIESVAHGTGGDHFDVASLRAHRVYLALLAAEPRLRDREFVYTVRTIEVLAGAPVPDPVVELYFSRP